VVENGDIGASMVSRCLGFGSNGATTRNSCRTVTAKLHDVRAGTVFFPHDDERSIRSDTYAWRTLVRARAGYENVGAGFGRAVGKIGTRIDVEARRIRSPDRHGIAVIGHRHVDFALVTQETARRHKHGRSNGEASQHRPALQSLNAQSTGIG